MAIRYIDNVTILATLGESVTLPSVLVARNDNGTMTTVSVKWTPSSVNTSKEGEFIHEGVVNGYVHKILCSVQVGKMEHNPESIFPHKDGLLDEFGLPKQDIQTADVPDIDDYQYFKAKIPRTKVEELQLQQLREMLADKIILARDVNHMRNALVNIEKFCYSLEDRIDLLEKRIDVLEDRVDNLEDRVRTLERETITNGRNLGNGAEVFYGKRGRDLEFRTITGGSQVDVYENGDEIVIDVDIDTSGGSGCGTDVQGDSFTTCSPILPASLGSGILSFSDFFNFQMIKIKGDRSPTGYWYSLLGVLGSGYDNDMRNSARFLKGDDRFLIEFKDDGGRHNGIELNNNGGEFYNGESSSRIQAEMYDPINIYSTSVGAGQYSL